MHEGALLIYYINESFAFTWLSVATPRMHKPPATYRDYIIRPAKSAGHGQLPPPGHYIPLLFPFTRASTTTPSRLMPKTVISFYVIFHRMIDYHAFYVIWYICVAGAYRRVGWPTLPRAQAKYHFHGGDFFIYIERQRSFHSFLWFLSWEEQWIIMKHDIGPLLSHSFHAGGPRAMVDIEADDDELHLQLPNTAPARFHYFGRRYHSIPPASLIRGQ